MPETAWTTSKDQRFEHCPCYRYHASVFLVCSCPNTGRSPSPSKVPEQLRPEAAAATSKAREAWEEFAEEQIERLRPHDLIATDVKFRPYLVWT